MSYADPSLELQKAIVAVLKADAAVSSIVNGRIYDAVPGGATKPYVSFGPFQLLPEHGDCLDGGEAFVTLDGWAAGPDTVQAKKLGTAIAKALDMAPIVLDRPQRCVEMSIEQTQYMRDPDGLTAHAVITVHAWTEPTAGQVSNSIQQSALPIVGRSIAPVYTARYYAALTAGALAITGKAIAPAWGVKRADTITASTLPVGGQAIAPVYTARYADTLVKGALPIVGQAIAPTKSVKRSDTLTASALPLVGKAITPVFSASVHYADTIARSALPVAGRTITPVYAPLGMTTTTISLDGLDVVFQGTLTHGVYVDGEMPWVVMPPGGVLPPTYSVNPGAPVYTGDFAWQSTALGLVGLGMMLDPDYLVYHPFDNRLQPPVTGLGPGLTYDAGTAVPAGVNIDHYPDGSPKTLWIARLRDAVQQGSMFSGVSHMIQITLVSSAPASNAIKPTGYRVVGGKRQVTTSDINYSAITPVAIPSGAVEPDWFTTAQPAPENYPDPAFGWLRRPLIQCGDYNPPEGILLNYIVPAFTQNDYAAYQASNTGRLLLGAISNSTHRNVLIERVVRAGLDVEGQLKWPNSRLFAGAGNTMGHKPILFFASIWLGIPAMRAIPPEVLLYHGEYTVPYFQEDGAWFIGATTASFHFGKPIYGAKFQIGWPAESVFGPNNDQRDPTGVYEPHARPNLTGTAQGGTSNTIQLAASTPAGFVSSNYYISLLTGPGSPQTSRIANVINKTGNITSGSPTVSSVSFTPYPPFAGQIITDNVGGTQIPPNTTITAVNSGAGTITMSANATATATGTTIRIWNWWNDTTKTAWMNTNWITTNPTSSTTYQYQHGGEYHFTVWQSGMASAIAIVASGKSAEWQLTDPSGAYLFSYRRWPIEEGKLNPLYPDFEYQTSLTAKNARMFLDLDPLEWTGLFYNSYAASIWPQQTGFVEAIVTPGALAITGRSITPSHVVGGTWITVWDKTSVFSPGNSDGGGNVGYTYVMSIPLADLSGVGGVKIRITMKGGPVEGTTLSAVYVGNGGSGDAYDFGSTPVQLKQSTSNTITIAAGGTLVTDEAVFTKDGSHPLVIAWQFEDAAHDYQYFIGVAGGVSCYYKLAIDAATVDKSGYTPVSTNFTVAKVELQA